MKKLINRREIVQTEGKQEDDEDKQVSNDWF